MWSPAGVAFHLPFKQIGPRGCNFELGLIRYQCTDVKLSVLPVSSDLEAKLASQGPLDTSLIVKLKDGDLHRTLAMAVWRHTHLRWQTYHVPCCDLADSSGNRVFWV